MKFLFIIKKWANFYFFIQNLSEWHFSNRKYYNKMWKKELGFFSIEEEKALKKFKRIHLKYNFGEKYLGRPFFLKKEPWKALKEQLSKRELAYLKNIFSIFQAKFGLIYKKDLLLLKKWQKELSEKANNSSLNNSINNTLSCLYNTPYLKGEVRVYLLFSSSTIFGGRAGLDKKSVTLEISRYPVKNIKLAIGAFWHEVIHAYFEHYHFLPLVQKGFPDNPRVVDLIQEITAKAVFFPGGILEKKFLNIRTPANGIPKKYIQSFLKIKGLVKKYIRERKSFDKKYIEKLSLSNLKEEIH